MCQVHGVIMSLITNSLFPYKQPTKSAVSDYKEVALGRDRIDELLELIEGKDSHILSNLDVTLSPNMTREGLRPHP